MRNPKLAHILVPFKKGFKKNEILPNDQKVVGK